MLQLQPVDARDVESLQDNVFYQLDKQLVAEHSDQIAPHEGEFEIVHRPIWAVDRM